MDFESLTPEQQEKAKAARTHEALEALAEEEGRGLSDEQLETVSGGFHCQKWGTSWKCVGWSADGLEG